MTWGVVHIGLWIALFIATLLYEYLTIRCTLAIIKLQSFVVANISTGLNVIGMGCVLLYINEVNNSIPILAAVYIGNYYAVELEKRKRDKKIKEDNANKSLF